MNAATGARAGLALALPMAIIATVALVRPPFVEPALVEVTTADGALLLADHLHAADETDAVRQLFLAALARPETVQKFESVGTTPSPSSPAELRERMIRDNERWGRAVRASGVKLD